MWWKVMELRIESDRLGDYLQAVPPVIQWDTPLVSGKIKEIESKASTPEDKARLAFEFVRDDIRHSFDTKSKTVTISAEDALAKREGICFAKSHVLATLLRGMGIPAGFCYQRVLRKPTVPESGHALHGLNALYLEGRGWFRVDPRGNKPGVDSQFSIDKEKLAYPIRPELGEVDYPHVYTKPLPAVIRAMQETQDGQTLFWDRPVAI